MAQLDVGFILARRFTLCAFAQLRRRAAARRRRGRPVAADPLRWRGAVADDGPIASSCGIVVAPDERLGDPARFDYMVVVGGLVDEIENLQPETSRFLAARRRPGCRWSGSAPAPSSCTAPG